MAAETEGTMPQWEQKSSEELVGWLHDACKNWLAHDGVWFQAVERRFGLQAAIEADAEAWRRFSTVEAGRVSRRLELPERPGLEGLAVALQHRMYAHLNRWEVRWPAEDVLEFRMVTCRVQDARQRKGLPDFPCRYVGVEEYSGFAQTIDPRVEITCVSCPPERTADEAWCVWQFRIGDP
jgi:hypothetical protein